MTLEVAKKYTEEEAAEQRLNILETQVFPVVARVFETYPKLNSAVLLVRHNEQGEAKDAVQAQLAFSVNGEPNLLKWYKDYEIEADKNFKGRTYFVEGRAGAKTAEIPFDADGVSVLEKLIQDSLDWPENDDAISMFSAYCPGADNLDLLHVDNFVPFAVMTKGEDVALEVDVSGTMYRPWLNGVMPLAEQEAKQVEGVDEYRESLKITMWKQVSKIPGGLVLGVQNYFDNIMGPEIEVKPDEPLTEFQALKMILGLFAFIIVCMLFMSFLGLD